MMVVCLLVVVMIAIMSVIVSIIGILLICNGVKDREDLKWTKKFLIKGLIVALISIDLVACMMNINIECVSDGTKKTVTHSIVKWDKSTDKIVDGTNDYVVDNGFKKPSRASNGYEEYAVQIKGDKGKLKEETFDSIRLKHTGDRKAVYKVISSSPTYKDSVKQPKEAIDYIIYNPIANSIVGLIIHKEPYQEDMTEVEVDIP